MRLWGYGVRGLKSYFYLSELCLDRTSASAAATASAHCGILPYYYITEVNHLLKFLIKQVRAEGPMEHIAQGKRSDTLGIACWSSRALKGQKL